MTRSVRHIFLQVICLALLSGCNGTLFFYTTNPNNVSIGPTSNCSPLYPNGACPGTLTCSQGTCVAQATATCSSDAANGICTNPNDACENGVCTAIPPGAGCSTENANGLCPGGQVCVEGYCFVDVNIECSSKNQSGLCGAGQTCTNGFCSAYVSTCTATNFGLCPTWQICSEGNCIGPVPPDACSSTQTTGRCPANQVCTGGSCTPITPNNSCSSSNPLGLCNAGSYCSSGVCIGITQQSACSSTNTSGNCSGGATCNGGICVEPQCGSGGYGCPAGEYCSNSQCVSLPCDPINPEGVCVDSMLACVNGQCAPPTCSPGSPAGVCDNSLVCTDGVCTLPPCSMKSPQGPCVQDQNNYYCHNGSCALRDCSPTALKGVCYGTLTTNDPFYGGIYRVPPVCCDANLTKVTGCTVGSCAPEACAAQEPNGACPYNEICTTGTCKNAPCSPFYPAGYCPANSGQQCIFSECTKPNCASQSNPDAYCSPEVCNISSNLCVPAPCSTSNTNGACPAGLSCCTTAEATPTSPTFNPNCVGNPNVGICVTPLCSKTYPGGICLGSNGAQDANIVCDDGICTRPPCSSTYKNGTCGTNFTCNGGFCVLNPCPQSTSGVGACNPCNVVQNGQPYQVPATCVAASPNSVCTPFTCSDAFPQAPCNGGYQGDVCVQQGGHYTCVPPPCSTTYPGGSCINANDVCNNGTCILASCSNSHPNGVCPRSQYCTGTNPNIHCQTDNCATAPLSNPNDYGYCPVSGQTCCTVSLVSSGYALCPNATSYNHCVNELCSTQFPTGKCSNSNQICVTVAGTPTCENVCNATYKTGYCPQGLACVQGGCATPCTNDQDCDTISDTYEGLFNMPPTDTDGDGVPDAYDHDSDNDTIPDSVEAGKDHNVTMAPLATIAGKPNFRSTDSDGDYIGDIVEVGPAPGVPLDTDGDGVPDYTDTDSDGDGILDRCEANDIGGLCANTTLITYVTIAANPNVLLATNPKTHKYDYRDTDSDADGILDSIEGRKKPAVAGSTLSTGVDSDGDGTPDYRDFDSDNDGVLDINEDINGDGIVNCQVNGSGATVNDTRPNPVCDTTFSTSYPNFSSVLYDYNPGCVSTNNVQKCLLAETDRIVPDTDGNGIGDGQDGINLVCSTSNLKPVNVFYSQQDDYAYALEQTYTATTQLTQSSTPRGMTFDDPNTADGSAAVSGFIINRVPDAASRAVSNANPAQALILKAEQQTADDAATIAGLSAVSHVSLVLNRSFTSFDGYGVVVSRYEVFTGASQNTASLRDTIAQGLTGTLTGFTPTARGTSPSATDFQLLIETLYRYDNGTTGTVITAAAVTPTGANANSTFSYNYLSNCAALNGNSTGCNKRPGCAYSGTTCMQLSGYQIPAFYADNITNGSAITQYGDNITALCDSFVQQAGLVDFLWTVDDSASMAPKIGQVVTASSLFFPILANSEADYRVAMTTTTANNNGSSAWVPQFPGCAGLSTSTACANSGNSGGQLTSGGCSWTGSACVPICSNQNQTGCAATMGCVWNPNGNWCVWGGCGQNTTQTQCASHYNCVWTANACHFLGLPDLVNGNIGNFTGAIGGVVNTSSPDRSSNYSCTEGCTIATGAPCCPACTANPTATPNDPACYFAARLPNDTGGGSEYGLLMTEWALYRAGAQPTCTLGTQSTCAAIPGCYWDTVDTACIPSYCANAYVTPTDGNVTTAPKNSAQDQCLGWQNFGSAAPPSPGNARTNYEGGYESPASCEYNPNLPGCYPTMGFPCFTYGTTATCATQNPRCEWVTSLNKCVPYQPSNNVLCNGGSQASCQAQGYGYCSWDQCTYTSASTCGAVYGCNWNAQNSTCSAVANGGTCRPPLAKMLRANAAKISVLLSDEEECYEKDGPGTNSTNGYGGAPYDGSCSGGQFTGGLELYNDPVRLARVSAYKDFMRSRGVTPFSLVGDQANEALPPAQALCNTSSNNSKANCTVANCTWNGIACVPTVMNGGCYNPNVSGLTAEAGEAYIDTAIQAGGGWGSICSTNLFPSIDQIVTTGLAQASPYRLEGFINGQSVQPISATIEVAVQSCTVASEYPNCASGTTVRVVPRAHDNGFDYDPATNALILYGSYRAAPQGSIVVSYRYWVNGSQPPQGTYGDCICPATNEPSCACPAGQACGVNNSGANHCSTAANNGNSTLCNVTPGCAYNTANGGFCEVTGLCAADPTCGGGCTTPGYICDSSTGLCVCDQSCGNNCNPGQTCDNNEDIHACQNLSAGACAGVTGCAYNTTLAACESVTCGTCICDKTCGGGCPAGQVCNDNTSSPTCGQCACDTTCGGTACPTNQVCDTSQSSPSCGLCGPKSCSQSCPTGFTCNVSAQICVCDTTCGGVTPAAGQVCDSNTSSATCGTLICDPTCGGGCGAHQVCGTTTNCGFCGPDPTCGEPNGMCNDACAGTTQNSCTQDSNCQWKVDSTGNFGCYPYTCELCNPQAGICQIDGSCGACGCNTDEVCNSSTGQCICDTTCGGGGRCQPGTLCDNNNDINACASKSAGACGGVSGCTYITHLGQCVSATCGQCVCDTTCGGPCPTGQYCNSDTSSGSCGTCQIQPNCGGCQAPLVCNTNTGVCGPDPACGGSCPGGYTCDHTTGKCTLGGGG